MGAPISSNPNFGVSAASKASQVKAKCLTKEELVQICFWRAQILQHELYIIYFENSIVTIGMHVDISSSGQLEHLLS